MTTVQPEVPVVDSRRPWAAWGTRLAPVSGIAAVLVVAAVTTPHFYTRDALVLLLFEAGFIGLTAAGQTLILLVGGIDLSVGAVIGMTTVIVASVGNGRDSRLAGAIALCVLAGLAVGATNAGLVLLRRVPPFVATFAVFTLAQGVITAWTKGAPSGSIPPALGPLGAGTLVGVPVPLWIFAGVAIVLAVVLARTSLGRRVYATGANPRAARITGVRTGWIIAGTYLLGALMAVVAGLVDAGYVGHVDAQLSRSLNLDSIAAAVIGGVTLTGGKGNMGNTVAGVGLLAALVVWLQQLGLGAGGQLTVEGAAILAAAWLQRGRIGDALR